MVLVESTDKGITGPSPGYTRQSRFNYMRDRELKVPHQTTKKMLLVSADNAVRQLLSNAIANSRGAPSVTKCADVEHGLRELARDQFDCVVLDINLPQHTTAEAVTPFVSSSIIHPPVIAYTGSDGDHAIQAALDAGALNFLTPDLLCPIPLERILTTAITINRLRIDQRHTLKALQQEREILANAQRVAHMGSWEHDLHSAKTIWSDGLYEVLNCTPSDSPPSLDDFTKRMPIDSLARFEPAFQTLQNDGIPFDMEHRIYRDDGMLRTVLHIAECIRNDRGGAIGLRGIVQDISDRKQTERAMERVLRMECVGELSGGIAHDFNNLLGIIIGSMGLAKRAAADHPNIQERINTALKAARRGKDLTSKMLHFASQGSRTGEPTNVNIVISEMMDMLQKSLTNEIDVQFYPVNDIWTTNIARGDLEDAVVNLAINARDAMPGGGRLIIETMNKTLDRDPDNHTDLNTPRDYTVISISDTGQGMPKDVCERALDPFFTTKEAGKGTGLGLSMVYGFARRSAGALCIYSEVGLGTTIQLYLPRSTASRTKVTQVREPEPEQTQGHGTILVVEDEPDLLEIAESILIDQGYDVLTAKNPSQALEVMGKGRKIGLLFTDVIMPGGVNGMELAREFKKRNPEAAALLTSGFTGKAVTAAMDTELEGGLLAKPYEASELVRRVHETMHRATGSMDDSIAQNTTAEPNSDRVIQDPIQGV